MTDDAPRPARRLDQPMPKQRWTTPVLAEIGTIHDVENGRNAGMDVDNPAAKMS